MSETVVEQTPEAPASFFDKLTTDPKMAILFTYVGLIILAITPIYVGSMKSIKQPKVPKSEKKTEDNEEESESEDEDEIERFSLDDAKQFPFIGSAALLSLFVVYKFFDKKYLNYLITAYFSIIGVGSLTQMFSYLAEFILGKKIKNEFKLRLTQKKEEILKLSFSNIHVCLFILAIVVTVAYSFTKNWILSNILGLAFSITTIPLLKLDSFKTGILLLSALFFYDIFWVFFTPVMVTVAKNFDAPIKMLFPRNIFTWIKSGLLTTKGLEFSMLGLGDIAIPGVYVALCARFDHYLAVKKNGGKPIKKFPMPYFTSCYISYILGLITTMGVMHVFNHAQPALLYLSPACIISSLLCALVRGEIKALFEYNDESEEEKKAREEKEKKEKEEKEKKEQEKKDAKEKKEQTKKDFCKDPYRKDYYP
jgi:minor histocompatibility antigen H13